MISYMWGNKLFVRSFESASQKIIEMVHISNLTWNFQTFHVHGPSSIEKIDCCTSVVTAFHENHVAR